VTFPVFQAVLGAAQCHASKRSLAKSPVFKRLLGFFPAGWSTGTHPIAKPTDIWQRTQRTP